MIKTIHTTPLQLGEGPIWDERTSSLLYVDILNKNLYIWDYQSGNITPYSFDEFISCVALTSDQDNIMIALESGIYRFNLNTKKKRFVCQPESKSDYRYNDGRVDWEGNWILGSMDNINNGPDATHLPDANLYQIGVNGVHILLEGVTISNGLAFQNPYVFYIDSKLNNIRKFKYDGSKLAFEKEVLTFRDGTVPDGMTISTTDKLYIANWGGSKIIVFDLTTETVIDTIAVPALNPTSCTFGGPEMNELFITTSQIDDNNNNLAGVYALKICDTGYIENKINW